MKWAEPDGVLLPVFFLSFIECLLVFIRTFQRDREKLTRASPFFFLERSVVGGVCCRRESEPVRYH